ncbi:MAG: radical SAM protein [Elusimicrobiales bacterium]|nr:radical SAM protein [Elusimicrobiales bacterium]
MTTDLLLLSQEETHPFYSAVNSYFLEPLLAEGLQLAKFSAAPPLGLTLLATAANARGLRAVPLYNFFSLETEKARLICALEKKPFAAGISTTHTFRPETARAIADLIRRLSPETHLIAGGPGAAWHPALRPAGCWTVAGPGEDVLPELVAALKAGTDPGLVPGVIRPGEAGPAVPRAAAPIEAQPRPDWGLYPAPPPGVAVQGSRGCPRSCGFCSYSAPYAARSAASVLAELRENRDRWGIRRFRFTDSDFACDPARALELCRGLAEDGDFSWTCFARADSLLAPGLAAAMRRAGCLWVFIGAESGSDEILRAMNKGCTTAALREGIAAARAAGLGTHGNFVTGYPGETRATLAATLAFARTAGLDTVYFSPFQVRSPGIPALAQGGLTLEGGGWRHATMSSEEMLKYTQALLREFSADQTAPPPGSEALFLLFADAAPDEFKGGVLDFFGAFKKWHAGGPADKAAAARTMGKYL